MKACVVVGEYYSAGQTFVNRHIEKLYDGNTCVIADKLNGKRPVDGRFLQRGTRAVTVLDKVIMPAARLYNLAVNGKSRIPFGSGRRQVLAFLQREKPDVILAEFGTQGVFLAALANQAGIPMFCYFRGGDASARLRDPKTVRAYKLMMPRLAGVFAVSQFLLDNLASVGVEHPNSVVLPSGVDVRRFEPSEKVALSCLSVGRFVEKKSPLLTLEAFARAAGPDATLTMVGDGPLLDEAKQLAADLAVADRVVFPGAVPHERVRDYLASTEVFLQHSVTAPNGDTEGMPTAIQEAMACGCVTVSTVHAGIPQAIDEGKSGYLVQEHDLVGFSRQIGVALNLSVKDRAGMGAYARRVACDRFDNAKLLTQLEESMRATIGQ